MAQLVVRNLDNNIKTQLQQMAKRNGRSMEEEVREILRNAVHDQHTPKRGLGTELSALFAKIGLDRDIPELRGHEVKPLTFDE